MIRALLFDLNGTLIDIRTDEGDDRVFRTTANFLDYFGIRIAPGTLKDRYFKLNRKQRKNSPEPFPEFDVTELFGTLIRRQTAFRLEPTPLAELTATVFRAASRQQLTPYPGVHEILRELQRKYLLAAVSDGQPLWAVPELRSIGLERYFSSIVISGDFGFRKPDPRLFATALDQLGLTPPEAVFIGNDMYRDIYGAARAGMKTVFFKSNQGDHTPHGVEPDYIIYRFDELPRAIAFLDPEPEEEISAEIP